MSPATPATPATYVKLLLTCCSGEGPGSPGASPCRASPLAVASWRFYVATLLLGALLAHREGCPRWSLRQWSSLATLGVTGVFFYNVFFLYGLQHVEAGRGALVVAFIPAMIALVDGAILRQPMPPAKVLGIVLALIGCLLVVTRGQLLAAAARRSRLRRNAAHGQRRLGPFTLHSRGCARSFSALAMTFGGCLTGWLVLTVARSPKAACSRSTQRAGAARPASSFSACSARRSPSPGTRRRSRRSARPRGRLHQPRSRLRRAARHAAARRTPGRLVLAGGVLVMLGVLS